MLAGRVKLRTFVGVAGAAMLALLVGGYVACQNGDHPDKDGAVAKTPQATKPARSKPGQPRSEQPSPQPVAAPAPAVDGPNERDVDKAIMSWFGKDLGSDKRKDVTSGQPFKVNLYQDSGNGTVNRAKVDLDRDDKFDEKWTFKGTEISRKVSSADDDKTYDQEFVWQAGAWVKR